MIEEVDEKKLDGSTPEKLQDQAWYIIVKMLGFCEREWKRQLNENSLKFSTNTYGKNIFIHLSL